MVPIVYHPLYNVTAFGTPHPPRYSLHLAAADNRRSVP